MVDAAQIDIELKEESDVDMVSDSQSDSALHDRTAPLHKSRLLADSDDDEDVSQMAFTQMNEPVRSHTES